MWSVSDINWRQVAQVAVGVGAVAGAVACATSIVCAVAVGAVAGAAIYAAENAGTSNWNNKDFATAIVVGAATEVLFARLLGYGGKLVKNALPGAFRKVTGYTKHGVECALGSRGDGGVKTEAILKTIRNGTKSYSWKHGTWKYSSKGAVVNLNWRGRITSLWPKKSIARRIAKY